MTVAAVPAFAGASIPPPGDTLDDACTPGGSDLLTELLWINVPTWMREACAQFYGEPGVVAVRPCQPPTFSGNALGTVLLLVHDAIHDKPGCSPTLREMLPSS